MTDGGADSAWTWTHHSYGPSASGSLYPDELHQMDAPHLVPPA